MAEIRTHLKRANVDQPVLDAAELAKSIASKFKRGVGDTKREEIRFLILSGLPHKEVVVTQRRVERHSERNSQGVARGYTALPQLGIRCLRAVCVPRRRKFADASIAANVLKILVGPAGLEPAT